MTKRDGLPDYDGIDLPAMVAAAVEATRQAGYPLACTPEVGRLLHLLAAHQAGGSIGELGTACGVGAAWLASGMPATARLTTVERDPGRAEIARQVFAGRGDVHVITGDWSAIAEHGPFNLLFSDGGPKRKPGDPDRLAALVRPGGLVVLDDYTPASAWSEEERIRYAGDVSRRIWLESNDWAASEVQVAEGMSVILAVLGRPKSDPPGRTVGHSQAPSPIPPTAAPPLPLAISALVDRWSKTALKASGRHAAASDHFEQLDSALGLASACKAGCT